MDKLIVDGKVSDVEMTSKDVTYLPAGRSMIADKHWADLKGSVSAVGDSDAMKEDKMVSAFKCVADKVVK